MSRFVLFLLLLPLFSAAQTTGTFGFEYRPDAARLVQNGTDTLRLAFAGGFNAPQFSPIELNGDGQTDLYAFDRQTGRSYTFLNGMAPGGARRWVYAPAYEAFFPTDLESWVLLRDYDCDGRPDLFTFARGGNIRVFRNVPGGPPGAPPRFELSAGQLRFTGTGTTDVNLVNGIYNVPAIEDVNGDGRPDILLFNFASSTNLELYLNSGATCGGLSYALSSLFWGQLTVCGCTSYARPGVACRPGPAPRQTTHTPGHSALLLDVDGSGSPDLVAGGDNCTELAVLLNSGPDVVGARFGPGAAVSPFGAGLPVFPAAYRFDANFDGRPDIVVTSSILTNDEDLTSLRATVRLFENTAAAGATPNYQRVARPFLQGDMLDVSEQAAPALADIDGDGRLDMLVGNFADQTGSGPAGYRASLHHYRNVGTARRPVFELVTDDYLGLAARGRRRLRPSFVDLNADGAVDLVYGATNPATRAHTLYFRLNQAAAGQPLSFAAAPETALLGAPGSLLPNLDENTATFFDVDNDGQPDLLLGTNEPDATGLRGSLRYYRNRGTGAPETRFELVNADFGQVRAARGGRPPGLAVVVADFDTDGQPDLLTLDGTGEVQLFANLRAQAGAGGAFAGRRNLFFNALTNQLAEARPGALSRVPAGAAADLDADGRPELLLGTEAGGLLSYGVVRAQVLPTQAPAAAPLAFSFYPNPTHDELTLNLPQPAQVDVLDLAGRRVRQAALPAGQPTLPLRGLAPGMYLLRAITADGRSATRRLAVE